MAAMTLTESNFWEIFTLVHFHRRGNELGIATENTLHGWPCSSLCWVDKPLEILDCFHLLELGFV
jgi:hypothetical protein